MVVVDVAAACAVLLLSCFYLSLQPTIVLEVVVAPQATEQPKHLRKDKAYKRVYRFSVHKN